LVASVKYYDSEIKINADVASYDRESFYTYKMTGEAFLPKYDGIASVFSTLDDIEMYADSDGCIKADTKFVKDEMLFNVSEGSGKIIIRQQFASEEKTDNEYEKNDVFEFNMEFDKVKELALNTASAILGIDDFKVTSIRRYGKYTKNNYYVFNMAAEYDGVTFSGYGKKVVVGKDEEGYNNYISLRGGNTVCVYIDLYGVSEISWNFERLKRYEQVDIMGFEELLYKFSSEVLLYSMNNFARFETNKDLTYKYGTLETYEISKIEMIYAKDFISKDNFDVNEAIYVPCWKLTAYTEKGAERNTVINAINGEIITTSLSL
jgi:hypothetical protein